MRKKFRISLLTAALCALCVIPAGALEYTIATPSDFLFGEATSDDTIYEWENPNVDRSKNAALIAPSFGTPTSYLPNSGELLTPNLVTGVGNVAVAGHNRGVRNDFGKLHTLKNGAVITLTTALGTRNYAVSSVSKVLSSDTSGLTATAHNQITLYTCVENQPAYRWCVTAVEKAGYQGAIFQTTSDSELIAYAIAQARLRCPSVEEAVCRALAKLRGAWSLIVMSPRKLVAARDPWGFRPLCVGRREKAVVFASESCALGAVGAKFERDLGPGEVVAVEDGQVRVVQPPAEGGGHLCIFEYIYFARPDSVLCGQSVHEARRRAGQLLAREHPVAADVVIGVPDSGLDAAMGYAEESGIPYGVGLVKNRYIGRTFITPGQGHREEAVRIKLGALKSCVEGKRVVLVDDSIVRGTTSRQIVVLLREAGAKEVHLRVSAPPFVAPCWFGTDIPDKDQLIDCKYSLEEIRAQTGADSLGFLSLAALGRIASGADCSFCSGCFTGKYPYEI